MNGNDTLGQRIADALGLPLDVILRGRIQPKLGRMWFEAAQEDVPMVGDMTVLIPEGQAA